MDLPVMPVRRLHNYAYCPRLFYLQWVEDLFVENADTLRGSLEHRNVDRPSKWSNNLVTQDIDRLRSLEIESEKLRLRGVVDLVEQQSGDNIVVDYKKGSPRKLEDGTLVAKYPDKLQLAAYSLLLKEQDITVTRGQIYYAAAKRKIDVSLTEELLKECLALLKEAYSVAESEKCPSPLVNDPRCYHCSAYPICLPNESHYWSENDINNTPKKMPPIPDEDPRDLVVVQNPRAYVGIQDGQLTIKIYSKKVSQHPIEQIRAIHIYGAVQISTQAICNLLERNISIAYFSPSGRYIGIAHGLPSSGVDARRGQYRAFEECKSQLKSAAPCGRKVRR